MKLEVPHSKDSEKYIKDVFSAYKEVFEPIYATERSCIIHLYAKKDTMIDGKDNLTGYRGSYLCEIRVYDPAKKIMYVHEYSDAVYIEKPCQVKVFKDLSTMMFVENPVTITYGSATFVY